MTSWTDTYYCFLLFCSVEWILCTIWLALHVGKRLWNKITVIFSPLWLEWTCFYYFKWLYLPLTRGCRVFLKKGIVSELVMKYNYLLWKSQVHYIAYRSATGPCPEFESCWHPHILCSSYLKFCLHLITLIMFEKWIIIKVIWDLACGWIKSQKSSLFPFSDLMDVLYYHPRLGKSIGCSSVAFCKCSVIKGEWELRSSKAWT